MNLVAVPVEAIPLEWPKIAAVLAPAIARTEDKTAWDLLDAVMREWMTVWRVSGKAQGFIVTRIDQPVAGRKIGWIQYVGGHARSLDDMREIKAQFEGYFARHLCTSIRISGRIGWVRVLPDYSVIDRADGSVEMEKVLHG